MEEVTQNKPSRLWYLLPVFFAVLGGVIGYLLLRSRDRRMAKMLLIVSIPLSIIHSSIPLLLSMYLNTPLPIAVMGSGSMDPAFYKGDLLVLRGADDYTIGDIVAFGHSRGTIPVIHRIVAMNEDGTYQLQGDANPGQLPYEKSVQKSQIYGKVVYIIPYIGHMRLLLPF